MPELIGQDYQSEAVGTGDFCLPDRFFEQSWIVCGSPRKTRGYLTATACIAYLQAKR